MRLNKYHRRSTTSFMNMTPMIDIVFLLIIFYISVYQITRVSEERLQLSQQVGAEDKEQVVLTINVLQDGEIRIQGNTYTVADTVLMVGQRLADQGNQSNLVSITIRADKRANSRTINELTRQFSQLGITQIRVAVETSR